MGSHHSIHLHHHVSKQADTKHKKYVETYLPVLIILVLIIVLFGSYNFLNIREINTTIGTNTPEFSLPPVEGELSGLNSGDFKGQVSLISVFASWCDECQENHTFLLELSQQQLLPVYGLNYKDSPQDVRLWLDRHGNPYKKIGADMNGDVAANWGVYGLPEIFVINANGQVIYRHMGSINAERFNRDILPLITKNGRQDEHIYPPEYK
ncbi:DsbE family thiol:disulfide interchange protein [Terasakiella pusilla]|uniref:DsbE family thiol:disulfide interchange protein n=1 Tax=Terasakiella pusilla TaxID=64973 RepID=UPI003AA8D10B